MLNPAPPVDLPLQRIRFWQHARAVQHMLRAYPPGADALVDRIHAMPFLGRLVVQRLIFPLYFAREEGWAVRGQRGELAAIMYLRRQERQGIRVMHVDEVHVDARYRRQGLAQQLLRLAEELARREQRPFLKLAVTVANTPAITLYQRLGYQAQRSRYFTLVPSSSVTIPPEADTISFCPLTRRQATTALQAIYEVELRASVPLLAPMLTAYYPLEVPQGTLRRYAIERDGQQIGYGDIYRRRTRWNLDLGLEPAWWGTQQEWWIIYRLAQLLQQHISSDLQGTPIALHLPSAAHAAALSAGTPAHADELIFTEQRYDRTLMVKAMTSES
jgi:GNAT superfamily N-acetyltransferase